MNARTRAMLAAVVCLIHAAPAVAADPPSALVDYRIASWTGGDGITLRVVKTMAQDRDGYLWLASDTGLVRFDGFRFAAATDIVLGATKLPEAPTRALHLAADESLWVGYGDGHGVYQIVNGEVRAAHLKGQLTGFVRAITEDRSGAIWVGHDDGLHRFRGGHWERISLPIAGSNRRVSAIREDRAGTLWVGAMEGLYRLPSDGQFEQVPDVHDAVFAISMDADGGVWITDETIGFRRVGGTDERRLVDGRGLGLLHDSRGNLWVATRAQGLWQLRTGLEEAASRVRHVSARTGLLSDEVSDFLEDRDGNLWVGALAGLHRLTPHKVRSIVDVGVVNALAPGPDGTIWAATRTGLLQLSGSDAQSTRRRLLPSGNIRTLHKDTNGTTWAATDEGLHQIVDGRLVPASAIGAPLTRIASIASDSHGTLWLCDERQGLVRYAPGRLEYVTVGTRGAPSHPTLAYVDRDDRVWVAFSDGEVKMRTPDGRMRTFGVADGLPHSRVLAIHHDRHGELWIAGDRGLSRLRGDRFSTLTPDHGLPPRVVTSVIDDDDGNLWLTLRFFGFVRLGRDDIVRALEGSSHRLRYRFFTITDGIGGVPQETGSIAAPDRDGRLWFVTGSGVTIFNPSDHRDMPPSQARSPRIDGVTADERRYGISTDTSLPPRTGRLRIDYTVVDLTSLDQIRFRYRLEGFDKDWVDGTMPRQAYYTNLPPGQYRFRVQAAGETQAWGEAEADWTFAIRPMFYETGWFYGLAVVALALLGTGLWRMRIRHVRKQLALVYNERMRLSRDIHDTLLQSLYGVALQLDAAPRGATPPSPLDAHLRRVRRQIDTHISEARQAIWDLRSPALNRQDLANALRESGEALTAGKVSFNLAVFGTPRRCPSKLETHVLRIGHEAIMNAVRHSGAQRIEVQLGFTATVLSLIVSDDGCGFDAARNLHVADDAHCGLTSMQERAADVGGRCVVKSAPGAGAQVIAEFPLAHVA